jgi:hypothetical protein
MLHLRNANVQESLGNDNFVRGVAFLCCTPTLDNVVTASLSQVYVNYTLGSYYFNCKNCNGTVIEVSEDNKNTWITSSQDCNGQDLLPMPSQSAYYRTYTNCVGTIGASTEQTSSAYSNEFFFVPSGYLNYKFTEDKANALFKITSSSVDLISATESVSSSQLAVPSASLMTSSLVPTEFFFTGSTSMSLQITGSTINYYTSSCVATSSIFLGSWKQNPNEFTYITASISHKGENSCGNLETLGYTANSFDDVNKIWYYANEHGVPKLNGGAGYPSGSVVGTAYKTNAASGDCRYNAVYLSGSITIPVDASSYTQVYMGIVTGSFSLSGSADTGGGVYGWTITNTANVPGSGSVSLFGSTFNNITNKNGLVGFALGNYISPFNAREVSLYVSGSNIATNPPSWAFGPSNLGFNITLRGEGIIRGFGFGNPNILQQWYGSTSQQSTYDCIYETTASLA